MEKYRLVVEMATFIRVFKKVHFKELSLKQICELSRSQLCNDSSGGRAFWSEGTTSKKKKLYVMQEEQNEGQRGWRMMSKRATCDKIADVGKEQIFALILYHSIMEAFQLHVAEIHFPSRNPRSKVRKRVLVLFNHEFIYLL